MNQLTALVAKRPECMRSESAWNRCDDPGELLVALVSTGADRHKLANLVCDMASSTQGFRHGDNGPSSEALLALRHFAFNLAPLCFLADWRTRCLTSPPSLLSCCAATAIEVVLLDEASDREEAASHLPFEVCQLWAESFSYADTPKAEVACVILGWQCNMIRRFFPWRSLSV